MKTIACFCNVAVLPAFILFGSAPWSQGGYTFTRIAASPGDIVVPGGAPTINNLGQVAFDGTAGPEPRIVRGEGGALTTIASPASPVTPALTSFTPGAYALDDFGHVAFGAYNATGSGVYRAGNFNTVALDDDTDPNIYPAISNARLAFRMATATGGGIFYGLTSALTLVVEAGVSHFYHSVGNPDINASGVLAFTAREAAPVGGGFGTEHIVTFTPGTGFAEVTNTTTGGWSQTGGALADNVVISDSGAVAFEAMKANGVTGVYVATPDAGGFIITPVAENDGPYNSFDFNALSGISINVNDEVAFRAQLDAGGAGIFTGPDPVADKVIAVGDMLDGKVVDSITFGRFALNDEGEVAFFATFTAASGGGAGVYRATPVRDSGPVTQVSYLLRSDAAPTDPDHALFSLLRPPMINGAGKISFKGMVFKRDPTDLDASPITAADDLAIWADKGSIPLALIAREGKEAPGTGSPNAIFGTFSDPIQSDAGEVAFRATLKKGTGTPAVTSLNADVIYSDAPGTLTMVARRGEVATGLSGSPTWKTFSSLAAVDGGCFGVALLNAPTNADQVFWAWDTGDPAPHYPLREGAVINFGAAGSRAVAKIELLNARTQVAGQGRSYNGSMPVAWVRVGFVGGGAALMKFTSDAALFDTRTDAFKVLPKFSANPAEADPAPGVSGAVLNTMNPPATNVQGHLAFAGTLKTQKTPVLITSANDGAIWAGPAEALALVVREGDSAPGVSNAIFASFGDPVIDDNGRVAFIAKMKVGTGGVLSTNDQGIWATTGSGLALIAREGASNSFIPAGTVIHSFTSMAIHQRGGLFTAKLRAGVGGVTTARDDICAVWRGADGTGTLTLRERQYVEVMPGHLRRLIKFDVLNPAPSPVNGVGRSFNSSGQVMSYCTFIDGTTGFIGIDL